MKYLKPLYLVIIALFFLAGPFGCGGGGSSGEKNTCGDGIVAGAEQCDDGNTIDGDCCSSDCQFEAAGKACDDGLCYNGTNSGICDGAGNCMVAEGTGYVGDCTVFVTSGVYDGALGGVSGADYLCQTLAQQQGLPGTFKAWLSDSAASAGQRLTHSAVPYVDVWGRRIADNWQDLTDGTLQFAILTDEKGFDYTNSPGCEPFYIRGRMVQHRVDQIVRTGLITKHQNRAEKGDWLDTIASIHRHGPIRPL
jgi:cysteine-rich repeat protein